MTRASHNKEHIKSTVMWLESLSEALNQPAIPLADIGFFNEKNVEAREAAMIESATAVGAR